MVTITIQRRSKNSVCTTGEFTAASSQDIKGLISGYTLELPWKDNQRNISCIPAGKYNAYIRKKENSKWDYDVIQLVDVPDRGAIQIHAGNYPENTRGCILVGTHQGKNVVWVSRKKLGELIEFCRKDFELSGKEEIKVIIKDVM